MKNQKFNKVSSSITILNTYLQEIKDGAVLLSNGTKELSEGAILLNSKMNELKEGTIGLANGMNTFNNGLNEFDKKGISRILNLKNESKNITERLKAMSSLIKEYQSFSLKSDSTKSNTKFILVTEGKKVKESIKKEVEKKKKESFIDRVINLFN